MSESRLWASGYGKPEVFDSRFRGHREGECGITQRHVLTSADGFCYLHFRSAVPSGRHKASRHDVPLGPCLNSNRKFLQRTEGGSLATPSTVSAILASGNARFNALWEQGAAGSNPAAPTNLINKLSKLRTPGGRKRGRNGYFPSRLRSLHPSNNLCGKIRDDTCSARVRYRFVASTASG